MQIDDKGTVNRRIAGAFKAAADATGTSFGYLLETSGRESDHRTELGASTSTAKGLFQFVDQTWLDLVKRQGPSVGLDRLADKITADGKGGWTVADPAERSRILALKTDPLVASVMAGKFTQENAAKLGDALGRPPAEGELYAAHVLGAAGAVKLIRMASAEPTTTAAIAFPKAAAANPALFYGKDGRPRTAAELLAGLTGPTTAATSDTARRITEAHAALAGGRADPGTVALMVKAQAAATVAAEPLGAAETATDPAMALRHLKATIADGTLPGARTGSSPLLGPRLDGWRAKSSADAFTLLLRSDPVERGDDAAAAVALAETLPTASRPATATLTAVARASAAAPAGGIPYVDPNAPLHLAAPPPLAVADPAPIARPSRLMTRVATGAPDQPLPMVDAARGATVPTPRLFTEATAADATATAAAAGAVRVRTTTISAATAPAAAIAARGDLATAIPDAPVRRAPRPLDLTIGSRLRADIGR
ncbi:hypothetical protein EYW49_17900 [Siculibacillus lacustris]|uniref:Lytic transglycosylase domain-containing protein n=1 Tax=Siculibacillus lacustris TaxID=1549641 RepID=A0A4Q9VHU7_9HYPH|nr:hypothetical protein [Siculibacillus lacustris]TBW34620.1 hypothetical protein EYW49_17900 [Siculibacillus lacustris]